jgi:hypothetical protein
MKELLAVEENKPVGEAASVTEKKMSSSFDIVNRSIPSAVAKDIFMDPSFN